jgi:NAD(P)-dependent dehydrogenase (short-subunit alcohol dehydrogenase family)
VAARAAARAASGLDQARLIGDHDELGTVTGAELGEDATHVGLRRRYAHHQGGTLLTVQMAVPLMTAGGSVIINGSVGAVKGAPGSTVYAASKAAVRSFARTWSAELAGRGIRVNLLSPGLVDTAFFDGIPAPVRDGIKAMVPAGRFGTPEEIAAAVLFLACDDSAFIYGTELAVDGGLAQV